MIHERVVEFIRAIGKDKYMPAWGYSEEDGEHWEWINKDYRIGVFADENPSWYVVFDLKKMKDIEKCKGYLKDYTPESLAIHINEQIQEMGLWKR